MSSGANNGPPPTRVGDCIFCGRTAQVRTFKPVGQHPAVQACYGCRPEHEPAQPRKFAVLYGSYAYLIQAPNKEVAERLMRDEADVIDNNEGDPFWDASTTLEWRAAWRRNAVVEIKDRKLPEGIE